jgi:glycosyltransferase involved in cell wall biosynthesis
MILTDLRKEMSALISIVIPSYNHRRYIGDAIASAQAQTYKPIELIVIDDGSTDGSDELIRERFGAALAHYAHRPNRGAHATINEAIAAARGEWVAILNSDDLYTPERIEKLYAFATANGHDLVFSGVAFCEEKGPLPADHKAVQSHARAMAAAERGSVEQALLRGNFALTTSNLMIRRAAFDAIGPFRPYRYCHDWDFLLRAIGRAKIGWLREPLLSYRLHGANTIREPDRWRHITENGLVYAAFLGDAAAPTASSLQSSQYVFESRVFSAVVVAWLMAECRRLGLAAILRELEQGILHERLRATFEPRFSAEDAGLTVRDIEKRLNRGALKGTLDRLRRQLTGAG